MIVSNRKSSRIKGCWWCITLYVLVLWCHLTTTTPTSVRDRSSWARFCGLTQSQEFVAQDFFTDKCPAGLWLDPANPVQWTCVCTMGSFALRFGWCTPEESITGMGANGYARFTPTDISCVHLDPKVANQKIQGLQALSKWSNRNKENGPYIWSKEAGGAILSPTDISDGRMKNVTLRAGKSSLFAMRVNPLPHTYYAIYSKKNKRAVCLQPPKETGNFSMFNYQIEYLWAEKLNQSIPGLKRSPKFLKMEFLVKPGCADSQGFVFQNVEPKSMGEYVLPPLDAPTLHPDCLRCLSDESPFNPQSTTEKCYEGDLDNVTSLKKEVDLQSERLAIHWGDLLLRNKTNPNSMSDIQEIEILKKAAVMAFGACDMNYIPKQFFQFFLIMFQAAVSESFARFPPQAPMEDHLYEQVKTVLGTCMEKTEVYNITVDDQCPPVYDDPDVGFIPIETPAELMAAPKKHDYILEFVWKLISFLHYHCYDFFQQNPSLHATLQVQMEKLFGEDLLLRWTHPSHSLKMLDNIFKIHLDVEATMMNFEKCVSVANKHSRYQGWLKKPISQPHKIQKGQRKKRSLYGNRHLEVDPNYFTNRRQTRVETYDQNQQQAAAYTTPAPGTTGAVQLQAYHTVSQFQGHGSQLLQASNGIGMVPDYGDHISGPWYERKKRQPDKDHGSSQTAGAGGESGGGGGGAPPAGHDKPSDNLPVLDFLSGEEPAAAGGGGGAGGGGAGGGGGGGDAPGSVTFPSPDKPPSGSTPIAFPEPDPVQGPVLDFPDYGVLSPGKEEGNENGAESGGAAGGSGGGEGYSGKKPFLDFQGDDDEGSYSGSGIQFGKFERYFACLYSLPDFAAQNPQYPLYDSHCWDDTSEKTE